MANLADGEETDEIEYELADWRGDVICSLEVRSTTAADISLGE
jgi:hypothetical protein